MVKLTIKTVATLAVAESACAGPLFKAGILGTVYNHDISCVVHGQTMGIF